MVRCALCIVGWLAVATSCAHGQIFELHGGSSTLYDARGASLEMRSGEYSASIDTGFIGGEFMGGGSLNRQTSKGTYRLGSQSLNFDLPTDVFNKGHLLGGVGAEYAGRTRATDITAFAGAVSEEYDTPIFHGSRAMQPAFALLLRKPVGRHMMLSTTAMVSDSTTAIVSASWGNERPWKLAFSGGVGANQPYGAVSWSLMRKQIEINAAYIRFGSNFRRILDPRIQSPEPEKENVTFTWHPWRFLSISGGRQHYRVPVSNQPGGDSTMQQAGLSFSVLRAQLGVIGFESDYAGKKSTSLVYSASRPITPRLNVTASCLQNKSDVTGDDWSRIFVTTADESLGPHFSLNETMNIGGGQKTLSIGGSLLLSSAQVSLDYATYYVPQNIENPFEQAMTVHLSMNLANGMGAHVGSFMGPDGHLLYTAEARSMLVRERESPGARIMRSSVGPMLLRGRVIDVQGRPIMGAALMIDDLPIFTDSTGVFYMRERRVQTHMLHILTDEFMDGQRYRIVAAPKFIRSSASPTDAELQVIVERVMP